MITVSLVSLYVLEQWFSFQKYPYISWIIIKICNIKKNSLANQNSFRNMIGPIRALLTNLTCAGGAICVEHVTSWTGAGVGALCVLTLVFTAVRAAVTFVNVCSNMYDYMTKWNEAFWLAESCTRLCFMLCDVWWCVWCWVMSCDVVSQNTLVISIKEVIKSLIC